MQPLDAGEPTVIGPYRLLGRLGAGGMGRVYLGRSAGGRTVAVKLVHPHFATDDEFRARFRREVAAARRVGGSWTAPVLDADPEATVPWVATGYVAGPPLDRAVTDHGPLPGAGTRALGAGLAEALAHVHGLGLVHRDVKPSNVLLTLDGPRLIDFGISRATDGTTSLTSTGVSVGSPGYMSPEQVLGKGASPAADVFSLGAVLAYAATGRAPFPGDSSAALLYKVVHEEPDLHGLDGVDGALRDVVAACLSKDPRTRPAPADLAAALAPGGAAALIADGWLPAALVAQVSRSAVALLDLDAGPEPAASPFSGPVPFSGPAVGPAVNPSGGGFGPPDPSYGAPSYGAPSHGASVYGAPAYGSPARGASGADVSAKPVGAPTPPPGRPTEGRGGVAFSMTAGNRRHDSGGRRMSCTLALSLAAAVAAVTLGGVFVLPMLGGDEEGGGDRAGGAGSPSATGDPPDAAQPGPTRSESPSGGSSAPPAGEAAAVPKAFVGTWKGPFTIEVLGTRTQAGTFTVKITEGRTGKRFATVDQYDALGNFTCQDALTLRGAPSDTELVTDAKGTGKSGGAPCTTGTHGVTLKLADGALTMLSDDARAGRPEAELSKDGS